MSPVLCQCGNPLPRGGDICHECIDALVHGPQRYTVEELRAKVRAANHAYAEMKRYEKRRDQRERRQGKKWEELKIPLSRAERRNKEHKELERVKCLAALDWWSRLCARFNPPQFDIPDLPEVLECRKAMEEFEARCKPEHNGLEPDKAWSALERTYRVAKFEAERAEFLLKHKVPQLQARYYGQLAGVAMLKPTPEEDLFSQLVKYAEDHAAFIRRKKDYARGNQLENFIRNCRMEMIAQAYGRCCVECGSSEDLQLDHLWLPKNEGGNFVMLHGPSSCLVSNVALLCRSCNAAKCDRDPRVYLSRLSVDVRRRIGAAQGKLTQEMTGDGDLCLLVEKWYKHKVATLEESLEHQHGLPDIGQGQGTESREANTSANE